MAPSSCTVVNKCYERRSLIVTTNLEFSRWGKILTDDQMAAAMIDRSSHPLVVFEEPTKRMEASPMARKGLRAKPKRERGTPFAKPETFPCHV